MVILYQSMTVISDHHKITGQTLTSWQSCWFVCYRCQFWKAIIVHPKFLQHQKLFNGLSVPTQYITRHNGLKFICFPYLQGSRIFSAPETSMELQLQWEKRIFKTVDSPSFSEVTWIQNIITPPKFNIAPEKWLLGDYFPFGKVTFQGLC